MNAGAKLANERAVALEVRLHCAACRKPLCLTGFVRGVTCKHCAHVHNLSATLWQEICSEADEHSFDSWGAHPTLSARRRDTPWGIVTVRWQPSTPCCPHCQNQLSLVEVGSEGSVACDQCGRSVSTRPVPGWLRLEIPTAMQLYAAARDDEAVSATEDTLPCPYCGKDCPLPRDANTHVTCSACRHELSLPELLAKSPLFVQRAFWMTFRGTPARIAARVARQKLEIRPQSREGPNLLRDAVDHTLHSVEKQRRDKQKFYAIVALVVLSLFGAMYYWRYFTKRSDSDDFTFDPRDE